MMKDTNVINEIKSAKKRIDPYINHTTLDYSFGLSKLYKSNIFLKNEQMQKTGSFKFRGALNKFLFLAEENFGGKTIAASSGNHGLGVALASKITKIPATIYVPKTASIVKVKAISNLGSKIVKVNSDDVFECEVLAKKTAEKQGHIFISPYNDLKVISGQGTIGLEIIEQIKDLDAIFISVGGGGLISGIGSYLKGFNSKIKVFGVWAKNAPSLSVCLKKGKIVKVKEYPTISDGTYGNIEPDSITFSISKNIIDEHILVTEQEIKKAMQILASHENIIVEGAAGVAMAGFLKYKKKFQNKNIAIILCGRNILFSTFLHAINEVK